MNTRELIIAAVQDSVYDLLYYNRKEDYELSRGDIEEAVQKDIITESEIIEIFTAQLHKGLV